MVAQDARTQRMNRLKRENRYGENAAGKWVRSSAFREIDCDPSDPTHLREFDTFEEAFAFDEECRLNGTGGRKAVHLPKPKDTVPKEQLALAPKRKRKAEAEALQPPMMKRPSHNHNPEVSDPELNNRELKNPELNNPVPPVLPVEKKEAQFEELQEKRKINDWNDTEVGAGYLRRTAKGWHPSRPCEAWPKREELTRFASSTGGLQGNEEQATLNCSNCQEDEYDAEMEAAIMMGNAEEACREQEEGARVVEEEAQAVFSQGRLAEFPGIVGKEGIYVEEEDFGGKPQGSQSACSKPTAQQRIAKVVERIRMKNSHRGESMHCIQDDDGFLGSSRAG